MATITNINRTAIGDWVDQLFEKLFFQPDDELAMTTWAEGIAPELVVKCVARSPHHLIAIDLKSHVINPWFVGSTIIPCHIRSTWRSSSTLEQRMS